MLGKARVVLETDRVYCLVPMMMMMMLIVMLIMMLIMIMIMIVISIRLLLSSSSELSTGIVSSQKQ